MAEPFITVAEFLGRVSERFAKDLTSSTPQGAVNETRVAKAVEDASDELRGWLPRISAKFQPSAETLRLHTMKVAVYLLTLDRPGKEFEQIRNAYTDTIAFYKELVAASAADSGTSASAMGGMGEAPCSRFNDRTLKGFAE